MLSIIFAYIKSFDSDRWLGGMQEKREEELRYPVFAFSLLFVQNAKNEPSGSFPPSICGKLGKNVENFALTANQTVENPDVKESY